MKTESIFKKILISQTRLKLISILFYSPDELYFVRQLVRETGEEINSVRRELQNLKSAGIINDEKRGHRLFYSSNPKSIIFNDLLLLAHKNAGLGGSIINKKEKLGNIKMLFFSYRYAMKHQKDDSIDLVLVGHVSLNELNNLIKKEENAIGREINYMVMDKTEFSLRKQKKDQFIVNFFLDNPLVIIGQAQDILNS
jgi:DNA-binding transcriptional regulator YhcF (GntR family)